MDKQELKELLAARNNDVQTFVTWQVEKRGGHANAMRFALDLIDQLDEPEITEEQAWNKIAETLPISTPELKEWVTRLASNNPIDLSKWVKLTEPSLPEVPQFVADWIKPLKYSHLGYHIERMEENQEIHNWFIDNREKYGLRDCRDLLAIIKIYGYTIEPPKTLQVIVKNYDSTVYKTELPEDEAMKLIEGWKEDEILEIK